MAEFVSRLTRPQEEFWVRANVDPDTGCWLWTLSLDGRGSCLYGSWRDGGRNFMAHRAAWIYKFGSIPDDLFVLHHCDTPACVNTKHLFLGTHKDNAEDRDAKGRNAQVWGERHCRAKLTDAQVEKIREMAGQHSQVELARLFGVRQDHISRILSGQRRARG